LKFDRCLYLGLFQGRRLYEAQVLSLYGAGVAARTDGQEVTALVSLC